MTCKPTKIHPNVAEGWGCCACKEAGRADGFVYNGAARKQCKVCGHARCDVTLRESPVSHFIAEHKDVLAVIRPADPQTALAEINRIMQAQKDGTVSTDELDAQYQAMLEQQEYTFIGILESTKPGVTPRCLDPQTGAVLCSIEPGDSFVSYHELAEQQDAKDEPQ